jgi:hypothetical protein
MLVLTSGSRFLERKEHVPRSVFYVHFIVDIRTQDLGPKRTRLTPRVNTRSLGPRSLLELPYQLTDTTCRADMVFQEILEHAGARYARPVAENTSYSRLMGGRSGPGALLRALVHMF